MLPILVVVSFEDGRGGGHLVRGAGLVRELRELGREAFLLVAGGRVIEDARRVSALSTGIELDSLLLKEEPEARLWAFVVLDRFATPDDEWRRYRALGAVVALDEGGKRRSDFDILVDLLPQLPNRGLANVCLPSLLALPQNKKKEPFLRFSCDNPSLPAKILIVFGAENAKNLSLSIAIALKSLKNTEITVITAAKRAPALQKNIKCVDFIPNLREKLVEFDLVITHFGLCAFEALAAGTSVMLASPSRYHKKLAKNCGFFLYGGKKSLYFSPDKICEKSRAVSKKYKLFESAQTNKTLAGVIAALDPHTYQNCPVCGADSGKVIARLSDRTLRRCPRCKTVSVSRAAPPPIVYSDAYFFEDYKKQYGKSYLEDFAHIKALGTARLNRICRLARYGGNKKRLLDIGCAYGPFLAAARDAGFEAQGIDASEGAARYVRETLGIPARQGLFPAAFDGIPGGAARSAAQSFDVITLWFVIEHFTEPEAALSRIHEMLAEDGVLAFSTPSVSGISGIFSYGKRGRRFFEQSPADHRTIWNPRTIRRAMRSAGFCVKKIVSTGCHGERVPLVGSIFSKGIGAQVWRVVSSLFKLGDTFEVYAVKSKRKYKLKLT